MLSQQVSSSRGRLIWFQDSLCQLCVWSRRAFGGILCLPCSDWSPRWLVCICTDASEKGFARDVASWLRRLVGSQSGQDLREAPGPSEPGYGSFAPSGPKSVWSVQVRTTMSCLFHVGSVAPTSLRCRCSFWTRNSVVSSARKTS